MSTGRTFCAGMIGAAATTLMAKNANLIGNSDFRTGAAGRLPDGWELVAPNPALAPQFSWD